MESGTSLPGSAPKLDRRRVSDRIVDDLRSRILGGELPDGSQLPSEQELASTYGVSAPTVREATRVLSAMGLITVRNGSRPTVTARGDSLLALSLASIVQVERVTPREVFGLLSALNAYAAELAAEHATDDEIAALAQAVTATGEQAPSAEEAGDRLRRYFAALATASHNTLLAALCRFFADVQIGLAVARSTHNDNRWGQIAGALQPAREAIVEAISARDPERAALLVREYHDQAVRRILAARKQGDPEEQALGEALHDWLRTNVALSR
jgi:GntR family transcriptional repressor for pyruvate dehydrogenase complex